MHNTSLVLLRNLPALQAPLVLIGPADATLAAQLPQPCQVISDLADFAPDALLLGCEPGGAEASLPRQQAQSLVIFMPKTQAELQLRFALARHCLAEGGQVWLVGEKSEGIANGASTLAKLIAPLAGATLQKIDSARHCQLWQAQGLTHAAFVLADWAQHQQVMVAGESLTLVSLPGVFSAGRVDAGSEMLLQSLLSFPLRVPAFGPLQLLDFGCGCGLLAAWVGRHLHHKTATSLTLLDQQAQAVWSSRATLAANGLNGQVIASAQGLRSFTARFDLIVTNPPFHQGVKVDTRVTQDFLAQIRNHLTANGELRLVANRFLPYAPLIKAQFADFEVLVEDGKYRVYRAFNRLKNR